MLSWCIVRNCFALSPSKLRLPFTVELFFNCSLICAALKHPPKAQSASIPLNKLREPLFILSQMPCTGFNWARRTLQLSLLSHGTASNCCRLKKDEREILGKFPRKKVERCFMGEANWKIWSGLEILAELFLFIELLSESAVPNTALPSESSVTRIPTGNNSEILGISNYVFLSGVSDGTTVPRSTKVVIF